VTHATLTSEQVAFCQQAGNLCLPAITTPKEVAELRDIYDRLFAMQAGQFQGNHCVLSGTDESGPTVVLPQILNSSKYASELAHAVFRASTSAITKQLSGPAKFGGDHAIREVPHSQGPTLWHQDEAYWEPNLGYSDLNICISLQAATLENGCLQFVPGSHRQEVLPHPTIGNDPRVIRLEVDNPEAHAADGVACPIPAGGAPLVLAGTTIDQVARTPRGRESLGAGRRQRISTIGFAGSQVAI
jgi:ectoine hydroxylase-related dioxygenase (phytanoyl-CoA dioxygenase family)